MSTLDRQVSLSANDCRVTRESGDTTWVFYLTPGTQRFGYVYADTLKVGGAVLFTNITIPPGSTINDAYLTFTSGVSRSTTGVKARIRGHKVANPSSFSNLADYQTRRGTTVGGSDDSQITTAYVNWDDLEACTELTEYDSPNIATVVQELVNQASWASGNAMAFFIDDHEDRSTHTANTYRDGYDYDANPTYAVKFHVDYSEDSRSRWRIVFGNLTP